MIRRILLVFLILSLLVAAAGGVFLTWGYFYITRDLPKLFSIDDYRPSAVSRVYAQDGTLIAEFHGESGRRYPVKLSEVPVFVRNCFIAAEDASFYSHPGIDPLSILRAFVRNLQKGSVQQGGSTITQQVVKNLLLTRERKLERKIKEAILSYRLENRLSKDEILEIYLNEIFFGNRASGIKAAARAYFRKELAELTLSEAAMLAGLPKAPARYSPLRNLERAKSRQRYVLNQMARAGYISPQMAVQAAAEEIPLYQAGLESYFHAPYYAAEVRRELESRWRNLRIDHDGLEVHTAVNLAAAKMAEHALRKGLREVDKRRGWRGPFKSYAGQLGDSEMRQLFLEEFGDYIDSPPKVDNPYPALVTAVSSAGTAELYLGGLSGSLNLTQIQWAKKKLDDRDRAQWIRLQDGIRRGDVIEVTLSEAGAEGKQPSFSLDQTPEIEGALVLIDPHSGKVTALVGGYSYARSQFNRVTQSLRQPGSAFKPIVYLAAIDGYRYTPATIVYDTPRSFRVGNTVWQPGNFDRTFLGGITLRTALQKSRNLVSADITSRIGVDAAIRYARKLGIKSPLGRNLSLSLGSSEVTPLEISRSYGVFAAKGVLYDSVFVTKIIDREGAVLYDYEEERMRVAKQVIDENSAFLMANLMKGVVERGTGWRVRELKRPVAGKTGTSNDQMDTWFVGFTPEWTLGVWAGFDAKRSIGPKETGGAVAAPIWLYFMRDFLEYQDARQYSKLVEEVRAEAQELGIEYVPPDKLAPSDFSVPDGVDPFWVDQTTGMRAEPNSKNAIYEYFLSGTEPMRAAQEQDSVSYLDSPEL